MLTQTEGGLIISVTLPLAVGAAKLFGALASFGIVVFLFLFLANNGATILKKLPRWHEKWSVNVIAWTALVFSPFWFALLVLTLHGTFNLWFNPPESESSDPLSYRVHFLALVGLMTAVAGLIGAPLALVRVFTTERQTRATEEGLITDQISKAVEGLGAVRTIRKHRVRETGKLAYEKDSNGKPDFSKPIFDEITEPNLEVRIGSIYALERIAKHNINDHIQIMEILTAYIRGNSAENSLIITENMEFRPVPRSDIQSTISVLGRRSELQKQKEFSKKYRLDLSRSNLSGLNFQRGDFSNSLFVNCRIEGAIFNNAMLVGARFYGSILNYSSFNNAELRGARFDKAIINRPEPVPGGMADSINMANIYGISVAGADLTAIDYFGEADVRSSIFGSGDTKLHHSQDFIRKLHDRDRIVYRKSLRENDEEKSRELLSKLTSNSFHHWPSFDIHDLALASEYRSFMGRLGLENWPFTDD